MLYSGYDIAGSYADNLKVLHANEFDLQVYLRITEFKSLKVSSTKNFPGLVNINMKDVFEEIKKMQQYKSLYEVLQTLVDKDGYLIPNKLQSWFQKQFTRILKEDGSSFVHNKNQFDLSHSQSGPAHTLDVKVTTEHGNVHEFSIDFVPVIKLLANEHWNADRNYVKTLDNLLLWVAVPKPQKDPKAVQAFQTSYDKMERSIIKFKHNFKNVDRLLKQIRDKYEITNFKSYYIKTVCLWVDNESKHSDEFWRKPSWDVLLHVSIF